MRSEIIQRTRQVIKDEKYINNWFSADSFFNESYVTGLIQNKYFITKDHFMNSTIYALMEITPAGINTIGGPLDSELEARNLIGVYYHTDQESES